MRESTVSSVGRASAVVLGVLAVVAAVNTIIVAAYAVDRDRVIGGVGLAALAGVVISVVLGYSAVRRWRQAV